MRSTQLYLLKRSYLLSGFLECCHNFWSDYGTFFIYSTEMELFNLIILYCHFHKILRRRCMPFWITRSTDILNWLVLHIATVNVALDYCSNLLMNPPPSLSFLLYRVTRFHFNNKLLLKNPHWTFNTFKIKIQGSYNCLQSSIWCGHPLSLWPYSFLYSFYSSHTCLLSAPETW